MNRTERFYRIDQMLHERRVVPIEAFLEALDISRATFKRDMEPSPNKCPPSPTPSIKRRNPNLTSPTDSPAKANGKPNSPNYSPPSPRWGGRGSWKTGVGWGGVI
jgi:hypothetical protein